MDCLHACEILSEAHDGELVDAAVLAEAREHARTCPECAAFVTLLARLAAVPAPRAPQDLVERLVAQGVSAAEETRRVAGEVAASQEEAVGVPEPATRAQRWTPRFVALASAAAVLIVALAAGGLIALNSGQRSASTGVVTAPAPPGASDQLAGTPQAESTGEAGSAKAALAAPSYVALNGLVWVLATDAPAAPSTPTTAGVVTSSLAADGTASAHDAYYAGATRSRIFVRADDRSYLAFDLVTRTFGRTPYALSSEVPIAAFGDWPTLPARFAEPTSPDGSPTFSRFGFDDRNLDVYLAPAGRIEDGFALAPGTDVTDPAAGNPNWTWWVHAP